jgi:hypothetical protein
MSSAGASAISAIKSKFRTLKMRLKMRLHFVICAWCRRYFEQINFLHHAAPRLGLELGELPGRGMSAEAKQRITQRIKAGF